jgi:hypothetical protein
MDDLIRWLDSPEAQPPALRETLQKISTSVEQQQ